MSAKDSAAGQARTAGCPDRRAVSPDAPSVPAAGGMVRPRSAVEPLTRSIQQKAMSCGYAVNEAVDNPAHAWITTVIVWITKIISVAFLGRLRRAGLKE